MATPFRLDAYVLTYQIAYAKALFACRKGNCFPINKIASFFSSYVFPKKTLVWISPNFLLLLTFKNGEEVDRNGIKICVCKCKPTAYRAKKVALSGELRGYLLIYGAPK